MGQGGRGFTQLAKGLRANIEQIPKAEILPQDLGRNSCVTPCWPALRMEDLQPPQIQTPYCVPM